MKIKTFGEVKTGDILYVIEYGDIPSIVEVHAGKIIDVCENAVTICINEKVPNDTAEAGDFKVDYVDKNDTSTFYDVFTTLEQAKEKVHDLIVDKINETTYEIGEAVLKIESSKQLINTLKQELTKI